MCKVCQNLQGKTVMPTSLYYDFLDKIISKANTNEPDFEPDMNIGEDVGTNNIPQKEKEYEKIFCKK